MAEPKNKTEETPKAEKTSEVKLETINPHTSQPATDGCADCGEHMGGFGKAD